MCEHTVCWAIIPTREKVQFQASQSELIEEEEKKRDRTHQTKNTWCKWRSAKELWGDGGGGVGSRLVYSPGGGEISRVISGRGRAPLLSGATLSEHVTHIVVDGTAAFYEHKSFSIRNASLSLSLSVKCTHQNKHTYQHTYVYQLYTIIFHFSTLLYFLTQHRKTTNCENVENVLFISGLGKWKCNSSLQLKSH